MMILRQFRKIIGLKNKKNLDSGKVEKGFDYISNRIKEAILESQIIVQKLQNLHNTNYQLGLDHLDKGNVNEAIFRFKIVRKFWPADHEAHLKLIYCYFILEDRVKAQKAIDYLLSLNDDLKSEIEQAKIDASFYYGSDENDLESGNA